MKKSLILLPLAFWGFFAQAKIITVNNNPNSAGMYTNVQTAHDAATVGDTMLIQASTSSYGDLKVTKRLVLLGEGHTNIRGISGNSSQLGNLYIDSSSTAPAPIVSGTRIIGLYINASLSVANSAAASFPNNVIMERCKIAGTCYVYGNNWNIRNNVISALQLYSGGPNYSVASLGAIISNNILQYISQFNPYNVVVPRNAIIQNNLFLNSNTGTYNGFLQSLSTCTVLNNIFYNGPGSSTSLILNSSTVNLTFTSNLNAEVSNVNGVLPGAGNSGTNNLNNQIPTFTQPVSTFNGISSWGDIKWMLTTTSPGHNYGTDGKDIGIYGGLYPWTPAMFLGDPGLPYVVSIDVQNAVVKPGDKVKFNVKAKSFGY